MTPGDSPLESWQLETPRLRLRAFELRDAGFLLRLLQDPGWRRFVGATPAASVEDAEAYLERGLRSSYREHGYGLLLVELRASHTPIGMCGLVRRPSLDGPDLGFAFLEEHTGSGHATEAGQAVVEEAFASGVADTLLAITDPENAASIRVLEKLGFTWLETKELGSDGRESATYRLHGRVDRGD